MAIRVYVQNAGIVSAGPIFKNPPQGFRWVVKLVIAILKAGATAGARTATVVVNYGSINARGDNSVLFTVTNSTVSIWDVVTLLACAQPTGQFGAPAGSVQTNFQITDDLIIDENSSLAFNFVFQAGDSAEYFFIVDEVPNE